MMYKRLTLASIEPVKGPPLAGFTCVLPTLIYVSKSLKSYT